MLILVQGGQPVLKWLDLKTRSLTKLNVPGLLEAFKADMTSVLSDMLQSSLSKFASQFNPSSGGQGDSAPTQTVASVPTVDVASNCDDIPQGPEDQSEGEIIDSERDPADAGIPILDNLKMSEEEQREYDAFSLASLSVSKREGSGGFEGFEASAPECFCYSPGSPSGRSQGSVSKIGTV